MLPKEQYIARYNQWNRLRERMAADFKSGKSKLTIEQGRNILINEGIKLGLEVDLKERHVKEPFIVFGGDSITGKKQDVEAWKNLKPDQHGCYPWQSPYRVPGGSRANNFSGECGVGCFCTDKNVDRAALNILNMIPSITNMSPCDGENHTVYEKLGGISGQERYKHGIPELVLSVKGKDISRIKTHLKPLCSTSEIFVDDMKSINRHDVCTGKETSTRLIEKARDELRHEGITDIEFVGKQKNNPNWWKQIADSMYKL